MPYSDRRRAEKVWKSLAIYHPARVVKLWCIMWHCLQENQKNVYNIHSSDEKHLFTQSHVKRERDESTPFWYLSSFWWWIQSAQQPYRDLNPNARFAKGNRVIRLKWTKKPNRNMASGWKNFAAAAVTGQLFQHALLCQLWSVFKAWQMRWIVWARVFCVSWNSSFVWLAEPICHANASTAHCAKSLLLC